PPSVPSLLRFCGLSALRVFSCSDRAASDTDTLSLHAALPISDDGPAVCEAIDRAVDRGSTILKAYGGYKQDRRDVVLCACSSKQDRKSTRLNSSHVSISDAVFCLKKTRLRGGPAP